MGGDGQDPAATGGAGGVEPQYATAKTSVWWDIENCQVPRGCDPHVIAQNISSALVKMNYCGPITISAYGDTTRIPTTVQQALSSTGIALNHVPAGVKDASDKKILVDMLFWAVDNPAPANYLLISGDRDFSNALHQLRMRRYNILLAQPVKASVALVAAAKCVWRWTSLVYGGLPFTNGENTQQDTVPTSVNENIPSNQPASNNAGTLPSVGQKLSTPAGIADSTFKLAYVPKSSNQADITRMASLPVKLEETKEMQFSYQSESIPAKQFMKAPHEFFGARSTAVASSQECNPQHVQGLICAILAALTTLKVEKIAPTEANIADCIRYGDPKYRNTDVRKALECALDQQMIVKHRLGQMELYVGRIERLWICENPVGGNTEQYPKATWDIIQKFLTSSDGRSALLASECRYEAALILKNSCLKTHPLGEVLRILNMIITMKKWIKIAHLGWKPITITLVETKFDVDSGS